MIQISNYVIIGAQLLSCANSRFSHVGANDSVHFFQINYNEFHFIFFFKFFLLGIFVQILNKYLHKLLIVNLVLLLNFFFQEDLEFLL